MAAGDATWNPKKGVAYRVTFPILDADGDLVTGATGLDSEVSKDGGTFIDCTNEATEIATSSGVYYLDLTATEMNADTVAVIVKTTSSGAKTTVLVMYPLETTDTPVDVLAISGDSVAADNLEAAADGTGYNLGGGAIVAASVTGSVGSVTGAVGSVTGNVGGNVVGSVGSVVGTVTANTTQLAGQTVTAAAGVTFPSSVSSLTAAGVRTELTTELGRIDVAVSSRLATASYTTPPTAAANASAVRTELTTELGRIDATISSRLATTGYTAPLDAAGTRSALGLATANLDTQLGDLPTATENAAAVWNAAIATYTASGSFGQRVLRSTNTQAEVAVTGSSHVAADIHELQPAVVDNTHFAAGAIDSNALAASAATEIATATLTSAMTESYRSAGASPTLAQAAFELLAHMGDSSISGTTKTLKKLDGTTAKTFTLDSSTAPTSITEAT